MAHVIALAPTAKQAQALARAAGCARAAYNWALAEWGRQYQAGEKPNAYKLKKQFNAIKREEYPWILESPKDANQQAFSDLGTAFKNFFDSCSGKRKGLKMRYPRFKRKHKRDGFYVSNDKLSFSNKRRAVKLPVIGTVRLRERLRFSGKVLGARCTLRAGQWCLSVQMDVENRVPNIPMGGTCGIDLNMGTIVTSDGEVIETPRSHRKASEQLRRANRALHRKQLGSKNRAKAKVKLGRVHKRIADIRKDFLHKVTTRLTRENQACVIEDLNVAGMAKSNLARSVLDAGYGMFRHMMTYKSQKFSSQLVVADRWFPSTKTCSRCGHLRDMPMGKEIYKCAHCGLTIGRDLNAALNLQKYPRLEGNLGDSNELSRTPVESQPLLDGMSHLASRLVEAGIRTDAHLHTF